MRQYAERSLRPHHQLIDIRADGVGGKSVAFNDAGGGNIGLPHHDIVNIAVIG